MRHRKGSFDSIQDEVVASHAEYLTVQSIHRWHDTIGAQGHEDQEIQEFFICVTFIRLTMMAKETPETASTS